MPEGLPAIPSSAWNNVPWEATVACFALTVLVVAFAPQILRYISGRPGSAIHVAGDLNRQALGMVNDIGNDLAAEREARIAARRDADRGWWLARHWNGECWRLLGETRKATALVFATRMAVLVVTQKYNDLQPDQSKHMGVPDWAIMEDGLMRPAELRREPDLAEFEAPTAPPPRDTAAPAG